MVDEVFSVFLKIGEDSKELPDMGSKPLMRKSRKKEGKRREKKKRKEEERKERRKTVKGAEICREIKTSRNSH
jgi:hypothetical protein